MDYVFKIDINLFMHLCIISVYVICLFTNT